MPPSRHPHTPNTFRLLTLGSAVLVDSSAVPVGEQRRRLALLALLAVAGERGVSRDVLVSRLSPESPADSARHALHQLLYYLRRQLTDEAFLGTDPLRLNPDVISSDVVDFTAALERGALEEAVALYRGPFLDGFHLGDSAEFEEWAEAERSRLAACHVDALARLAAAADARGDHQRAIDWWQRLVLLDPLSGRAELGLMQALAAAGDAAGALQRAHIHQSRIRAELGIDPDPQVAALAGRLQHAGQPVPVVDRVELHSNLKPRPSVEVHPQTPRRILLMAGGLGSALMLAFVAVSAWVRRPAPPEGNLVAVAPFRVSAADTGLAWLREGMVELLSIRLTGEGGMQVAEPGRFLSAWHRKMPAGGSELTEEAVWSVAAGIGAGRVVQGSVTGGPRDIGLIAWMLAPGGQVMARASVNGPSDSLPHLVDRLAVQLLGLGAEIEPDRLSSLTSTSLPATRAFLAGRAAFRSGRMEEAEQKFRQAVYLDSSFALAGLDLLRASGWGGAADDGALGGRIAQAGRTRLSAIDQALLDATQGQWINAPVMFRQWNAVVSGYPDRPEGWYGLGDAYFHWGALSGDEDFAARAEDAFRRGWRLDSAAAAFPGSQLVPEPVRHLVELAHMRGDTAEVRRLVTYVLSVDSSSHLAQTLRWHLAVIDGDSARRRYWAAAGAGLGESADELVRFATWTGIGAADLPLANALEERRYRVHDPGDGFSFRRSVSLNSGRPSSFPLQSEVPGDWLPREGLRSRIREAMHWDGDSATAVMAVRVLSRYADAPPAKGQALRAQLQDVCAVGNWQAAGGGVQAAESATRKLKAAHLSGLTGADSSSFVQSLELCAALLDAAVASASAGLDARGALDRADSLARTNILEICCGEAVTDANLLLARLWERQGQPRRALEAIRRRASGFGIGTLYLSTFLREEGRLSLLTGDTAGAVRAYHHYLGLRYAPEPALRPQVDSVRRLVARLER